jgi:hypothetical protein
MKGELARTDNDAYLLLSGTSPPEVSLLGNRQLSTLALWQRYPRFSALTDNKDVGDPCCECTIERILDMDDIETTNMLLAVNDDTCTTHVATTSDHDDVAGVEGYEVGDFSLLKVKLYSVVDLNDWIGITDCASVVCDNVGDTLGTEGHFADLEKFVGSLLGGDAMDSETAFHVIQQAEMFARLFDRDDIHETGRIGRVGAHFSIDFNEALVHDCDDLAPGQSILEPVSEKNRKGKGFAESVRTGGWAGSVGAAQLVKHP